MKPYDMWNSGSGENDMKTIRFSYGSGSMSMIDIQEQTKPGFRSKQDHPYSYDPFTVWMDMSFKSNEDCHVIYSDRMSQWDYQKNRTLQKEHLGKETDYLGDFTPNQLTNYLSAYLEREIIMIRIQECCNVSNGYPLWVFWFKYKDEIK